MTRKPTVVFNFGINDADYVTQVFTVVNGKRVSKVCPFFRAWKGMIQRCYSSNSLKKRPTYEGCYVSLKWKSFMAFRAWMITQDWEGKSLDKDILFYDNKEYSPEKCVFVSKELNSFFTDSASMRGNYPIGVSFHAKTGKFQSNCKNPLTNRKVYLGLHETPESAHLAWRDAKHFYANELAQREDDPRIKEALINRYRPDNGICFLNS